jgi:hypothetical protein
MKSLKKAFAAVKSDRKDYRRLINAVISRVSLDSVSDIVNHGINGGFSGFVYYTDTIAFFDKYKADILRLLKEEADELGEKPIDMALSFNCFDKDCETAIGQFVYGARITDDYAATVKNGFAWYAAEEVCRWIDDETNN